LQRKASAILIAAIILLVASIIIYFSYNYILGVLNPRPDFIISATPSMVTLSYIGSHNETTITVESLNGMTGNIELNVEMGFGIIGIDYTLSPPSPYLPANGQVTCVLRFVVKSSVPLGGYYVDVVGVVGNVTHQARITIEVSP